MAFSPIPGAWCEISGIRLKIFDAEISANQNSSIGQISDSEDLIIACGVGTLRLTIVQPAGKNKMSGNDFMRGYKNSLK
jgi:methionyl-tRNA formyltransferase